MYSVLLDKVLKKCKVVGYKSEQFLTVLFIKQFSNET